MVDGGRYMETIVILASICASYNNVIVWFIWDSLERNVVSEGDCDTHKQIGA